MTSREQQQEERDQQNGNHHHHPPPPRHGHNHLPPPPPFQNGHHHQHYSHRRPYYSPSSFTSSASFKGCCCCIFLLLGFLALLAVAIILIIVLAVKPKKPQFDLQQVGVQYMGIDPNTAPPAMPSTASASTSATLSLNIRLLFNAVNPNKVGIKYDESRFTVMYRGIPLGKASVPPFYQKPHSVRQVEATIAVDRVNLLQADAADLVRDASLNDRVELRIFGDIGAKIRVLEFDSPGVEVSVDCAIVISPRKQSLTYKQCGIDGVNL